MVSGASLRWLVGDIVAQQVDVLVCTANVWGNMSGGGVLARRLRALLKAAPEGADMAIEALTRCTESA